MAAKRKTYAWAEDTSDESGPLILANVAAKRKRDALEEDTSSESAPLVDWPVGDGTPHARLALWDEHSHNSRLWDLTLRAADGTSVPASRLDLCDASDHFKELLLGDDKEARRNVHKVKDARGVDLRNAIRSLYSGQVALNWERSGRMLALACRLQLRDLRAACCAYLKQKHLDIHALDMFLMAKEHECNSLGRAARAALLRSPTNQLLPHLQRCTLAQLTELLSANELRAGELEVHNALCSWYKNYKQRSGLVPLLCKTVKYERMSSEDWAQLLDSPEVQGNSALLLHLAKQLAARPMAICSGHPPCQSVLSRQYVASGEAVTAEACLNMEAGHSVYSKHFSVRGLPHTWRLKIYPRGSMHTTHVSLFLECCDFYHADPPPKVSCEFGVQHPSQTAKTLIAGSLTEKDFSSASSSTHGCAAGLLHAKLGEQGFVSGGTIRAYAKVSVATG